MCVCVCFVLARRTRTKVSARQRTAFSGIIRISACCGSEFISLVTITFAKMQSTLGSDTDEAIGTDTVQPPSNFVPAQKPLSHIAQLKTEAITNWLTRQNLLTAARGGMPRRAAAIKDYPLHLLPPLDPFSPSFAKETAFRLEQVRKNEENQ